MAGWHHWLDGCESEWSLGVGDGQGGLACCDSWGPKESDTTERLIWRSNSLKLKDYAWSQSTLFLLKLSFENPFICCFSATQSCSTLVTPWNAACRASVSFTISQSSLKLMSLESVILSNHFVLCHPFLLSSILPSSRVFSNKLDCLCLNSIGHLNGKLINEYILISNLTYWKQN